VPTSRGLTRGTFIAGSAGVAGVAVVAAAGGAELLSGQGGSSLSDSGPLGLALAVERLQSAFYGEALARGALEGELLAFATTAQAHEEEHASLLVPLVSASPEEPAYDFGEDTTDPEAFAAAAATLEDLAVSAYNGFIPSLSDRGLVVAGRIVSVDARHAAWIRAIIGRDPASEATDPGLSAEEVIRRVEATGYIQEPGP
jgi:Ferritin-like domain